jgi:sterol desaturase/sphingolipid hydroxylase (fatty acid hydroxylase superfamily)
MASILGSLLLGWLLADFLSGLFHWWEDRIGYETTPFLGTRVVVWNRIHHRNPDASLKGGFWYRNRDPILGVIFISIVWIILAGPSLIWFAATIGGMVSNEVHFFTHHPLSNKALVVAQEIGILQSPKHHSRHHSRAQDVRYCVLTNFLNPVLDAVGFWTRLEHGLVRLGFSPSMGRK